MRNVSRPKYCSERWLTRFYRCPERWLLKLQRLCGDQCRSIDFQPLPIIRLNCPELLRVCCAAWLLLVARVNFQFTEHSTTAGAGSMPLTAFQSHAQDGGQSSLQGRLFGTTDVAGVVMVTLSVRLLPVTATLMAFRTMM